MKNWGFFFAGFKKNKLKFSKSKFIRLFGLVILLFNSCSSYQPFNPKNNDSNNFPQNENEFSLITYNLQTVFGKGSEKVSSLTKYLNSHLFDFVLMQEVFDEKTREKLLDDLDASFYKSRVPRIDYNSFPSSICQDAGLFSVSRFPQVDLSKYDFDENTHKTNGSIHQILHKDISISLDFLANKSVLGSLYQINDSTKLFLFSTHLQAISSKLHKTIQLEQIYSFIVNAVYTVVKEKIVSSQNNLIVILAGDFNYNAYSDSDLQTLKEYLGNPRDLHKEFNLENQEYTLSFKLFGFQRRVDFIFAYDNIGLIKLQKVGIKSINVTNIIANNGSSISDHFALKAKLFIN